MLKISMFSYLRLYSLPHLWNLGVNTQRFPRIACASGFGSSPNDPSDDSRWWLKNEGLRFEWKVR